MSFLRATTVSNGFSDAAIQGVLPPTSSQRDLHQRFKIFLKLNSGMPTLCHTLDDAIGTYNSISSSQNSLVLENQFFLETHPVCDSSLVGVSSKISKYTYVFHFYF